jgi:hypothetical protein
MPDDFDPQLRRWFAERAEPPDAAAFVARVTRELGSRRGARGSVLGTVLAGLTAGVAAALRPRQVRLVAIAAAAIAAWAVLQGS